MVFLCGGVAGGGVVAPGPPRGHEPPANVDSCAGKFRPQRKRGILDTS